MVSQKYEFYEQDSITGRLFRMKDYQHGDYRRDFGSNYRREKAN